MAVRRSGITRLAAKRAQLAVISESGIKPNEIFHFYFRTTERKRQAVERFGAWQCDSGAAQKFVKRRMRKLGCQLDRGKIAAASERIARTNWSQKFTIKIFRIVIAETARRVRQDRQWMNQPLIDRERVNEGFERGARGALT